MTLELSVILTTYNCAERLPVSLPNLISNLTSDCELIVVDDGSTDNTVEIVIQSLPKSSEVKIFSLAHNGSASVRNFALSEAQGKYVMFCDSDDILRLDRVLSHIPKESQEIDFLVFDFTTVDFDGVKNLSSTFVKSRSGYVELRSEERTKLLRELGFWRIMYKRAFLLDNRIRFFSTLKELQSEHFTLDDYFFLIQVIALGATIQVMEEEVYVYYQNPQSTHEKYRIQSRYVAKTVKMMLKFRHPLDFDNSRRIWLSNSLVLQLISSFCSLSTKDAAKYVWSFIVAIWMCGVYGKVLPRRLDLFSFHFVKLVYSFVRSRSLFTRLRHLLRI